MELNPYMFPQRERNQKFVSEIYCESYVFRFIPTLEGPITPWFNMIRRHRLKLWWDNLHRLKELAEPEKIQKFNNEK